MPLSKALSPQASRPTFASVVSRHAWEALGAVVRVDHRIRETVVFLGVQGAQEPFIPVGTGFFTMNSIGDFGFQTLVTAKHVVDRVPSNQVFVRINTRDGGAEIHPIPKEHWVAHKDPDVDVIVAHTNFPRERFQFLHLEIDGPNARVVARWDQPPFKLGDEIFMVGMFVSRLGEMRNLPIIRIGTIAALAEEKIRTEYGYHHAFLVEARSSDGLSGSPVFAPDEPIVVKDGYSAPNPDYNYHLFGLMLGHNSVHNPDDMVEIYSGGARGRKRKVKLAPVPLNTGIGVVLPLSYVIEAIDQLREPRERRMAEDKKKSSFVADSAVKSEPPATADNPSHKEDFTSLLGAAAKKKSQDA